MTKDRLAALVAVSNSARPPRARHTSVRPLSQPDKKTCSFTSINLQIKFPKIKDPGLERTPIHGIPCTTSRCQSTGHALFSCQHRLFPRVTVLRDVFRALLSPLVKISPDLSADKSYGPGIKCEEWQMSLLCQAFMLNGGKGFSIFWDIVADRVFCFGIGVCGAFVRLFEKGLRVFWTLTSVIAPGKAGSKDDSLNAIKWLNQSTRQSVAPNCNFLRSHFTVSNE